MIGLPRYSWGAYLGNAMGQSYIADEKENFSFNKMPIMATDCEYNNGLKVIEWEYKNGLTNYSKIGSYRYSWGVYLGNAMGQCYFADEKRNKGSSKMPIMATDCE